MEKYHTSKRDSKGFHRFTLNDDLIEIEATINRLRLKKDMTDPFLLNTLIRAYILFGISLIDLELDCIIKGKFKEKIEHKSKEKIPQEDTSKKIDMIFNKYNDLNKHHNQKELIAKYKIFRAFRTFISHTQRINKLSKSNLLLLKKYGLDVESRYLDFKDYNKIKTFLNEFLFFIEVLHM